MGRWRKYATEAERKEAWRQQKRRWAKAHQEQANAYMRKRYHTDPEFRRKRKEANRRWKEAHPTQAKALMKKAGANQNRKRALVALAIEYGYEPDFLLSHPVLAERLARGR